MIEKHTDYISFINSWITSQPKQGYGLRSKLAAYLNVQTSYISQILSGTVLLKEEHAILMVSFFGLDELEADYFFTLVSLEKAGTDKLKRYYKEKAAGYKAELKKVVRSQKGDETYDKDQYEKYFSSWAYVALHILSSIEAIELTKVAKSTGLSETFIKSIVDYLEEEGFLVKEDGLYRHSKNSVHIPKGHKWLNQHHANWRIKAIDKTQMGDSENLHYTSVISCSKKDAEELKDKMRDLIKSFREIVKSSEEEIVCCYNIDFFSVFEEY